MPTFSSAAGTELHYVLVGDGPALVHQPGWFPAPPVRWLPGCGRFPWLNDPAGVASAVEDALGEHQDGRR